jgi:hypothetical protein
MGNPEQWAQDQETPGHTGEDEFEKWLKSSGRELLWEKEYRLSDKSRFAQ